MKKVLITGATGFVGNYLIDHIQKNSTWSIAVTKMKQEQFREDLEGYDLDLLDQQAVTKLLNQVRPDYIFHLAAQSSVALSWKQPDLTVDVNIKGTLHLLEAVRQLDYSPRVMLIGSGEEYGYVRPGEIPVTEENPVRPGNIYAATKTCQNMFGKIYSDAYDLDIISVRAFNHIGPNQSPVFVAADFCRQVAEIEKGGVLPVIRVGNLSAKRDFTDVRDVVRAYVMLMEHGKKGETYNVGSGHAIEIRTILDEVLKMARVPIVTEVEESRIRPIDVPVIEADITKLEECCGWKPEISLNQTLKETLYYWRGWEI